MRKILDLLFPPREDELALRGIARDEFLALLAPRLVPATRPGTAVMLPFAHPAVRSAIHEAKYHGDAHAFALLASALADYLRDSDYVGFRKPYIVVVPVPLGRTRRKERGYNQAEEVARRALRTLGKEFTDAFSLEPDLLLRTRETASQVSLPRRLREENMRGAFGAAHILDPSPSYLVIDDVVTTGATMQAAIDALRAAGAEHVIPLALAH